MRYSKERCSHLNSQDVSWDAVLARTSLANKTLGTFWKNTCDASVPRAFLSEKSVLDFLFSAVVACLYFHSDFLSGQLCCMKEIPFVTGRKYL